MVRARLAAALMRLSGQEPKLYLVEKRLPIPMVSERLIGSKPGWFKFDGRFVEDFQQAIKESPGFVASNYVDTWSFYAIAFTLHEASQLAKDSRNFRVKVIRLSPTSEAFHVVKSIMETM